MPREKQIRQMEKAGELLNHLFRVRKKKIVEITQVVKNQDGKIAYLVGKNQITGRDIRISLPCQKLVPVHPKQIHPLDPIPLPVQYPRMIINVKTK